jgi:hypothetical protein
MRTARVEGGIVEGSAVDAIATALGLPRETLRSQLKAPLSRLARADNRNCSACRRVSSRSKQYQGFYPPSSGGRAPHLVEFNG